MNATESAFIIDPATEILYGENNDYAHMHVSTCTYVTQFVVYRSVYVVNRRLILLS